MNQLLLLIVFLKSFDGGESVVGGRKTKANKYPWLAHLEILSHDGKESQCGGTVISARHILTAAHCLMDKCGRNMRKITVHLGAHDICEEDWTSTHVVRPSRYIFHPGYDPKTDDNDIAILKLKRDVNFGPKVWIISLPPDEATRDCQENENDTDFITIAREDCEEVSSGDDEYYYDYEEEYYEDVEEYENFEPGEFFQQTVDQFEEFQSGEFEYDYEYSDNCTTYYDGWWASIAGWGATYKFDGSCILRHARKKIYPNHHELCLDEDYVMDRGRICAYNPKWSSDTCQGDSGSGLIVVSDTGPVLVGVVSYGWDCGDNRSPGVYSRVQFFKRWIMKIVMEGLP